MKYSQSNHFAVDLTGVEGEVQLEIRDWGSGFDVEDAKRSRGLGLLSMQERVHLVHGKFSIDSSPGQGTSVLVSVPLPNGSEEVPGENILDETAAGMGKQ
jgi:signal transduction histidine kinase